MTNLEALEQTLASLRAAGRLEDVDAAREQALRSMASTLDERGTNAQLWKIYHVALERLITDERNSSDAIDRAWAELHTAMGDAPKT